MSNYQFPRGTKLNPPVNYNGHQYSYGYLFDPMPSNQNNGYSVVSGRIQSVTALASGQYEITCERGYQYSSYTVVGVGGGGTEVSTSHSTGGNIVNSKEIDRVRSWNNEPMASMGSLESIRAVTGDGLQIIRAGKNYLWEILSAQAYSKAPSQVNYNGDIPLPAIGYVNADINQIQITTDTGNGTDSYIDGAQIVFDETWDQIKYISNLYVGTTIASRVFKDQELPSDFGAGLSGAKYYTDGLQFRLISDAATISNSYNLQWMLKGANKIDSIGANNYFVVQRDSAPEFLTAGDNCLLSGTPVLADFDLSFILFAPGSVQWRQNTDTDAISLRFSIDSGGNLACSKRASKGGSYSALAIGNNAIRSFPCTIRVQKAGGTFKVYTLSGSYVEHISTTFAQPDSLAGLLGVTPTSEDLNYVNNSAQTVNLYQIGNATGNTYLLRYKTGTFSVSREYPKPSNETITEVYNLTTNEVMTNSALDRRNTYTISGANILLNSESSGDRIRITCAAPSSLPPAPGVAPRTFAQPNFADNTTNVNTNRANWRDSLVIQVEDAGFVPQVGEEFSIIRGRGVWSTSDIPVVYIDFKNENTNWVLLDAANYHLRAYQGLLLLKQSFVDTLDNKPFCIKIEGKRYRAGANAGAFNEFKHALEMMDSLYFECQLASGTESSNPSGFTSGMSVDYGDWACTNNKWVPNLVAYGTIAESIRLSQATGAIPPYWATLNTKAVWTTTRHGSVIIDPSPSTLSCGGIDKGEYDYVIPNEEYVTIAPYDKALGFGIRGHWTRENWQITGYDNGVPIVASDAAPNFDNYTIGYVGLGGSFVATSVSSGFSFDSIPVQIPPEIRRLPDGCTIVDAKLRVKFGGMRSRTLKGTARFDPDGETIFWDYYEMGQLAQSYHRYRDAGNNLVEETFSNQGIWAEPTKGGSVGFQLIGGRKNTKYVLDYNNNTLAVPDVELHSLGGSIASNVVDGKWSIIDATGIIRAMYNNRHKAYSNYWLYPTNAQVDSSDGVAALANFVKSLSPTTSAELLTGPNGTYGFECEAEGKVTWWSTLEIASCHICFRLGNGVIQNMVLPLPQPKHITL